MEKIEKAKQFAKEFHKDHKRLSGESYYEHSQRVFEKLQKEGVTDESILTAALLHQVFQHSNDKEETIEKEFGPAVLNLLINYRDLTEHKIHRQSPKQFNEKYLIQTFLNLAQDLNVLVIRLADRTDNIETSYVFSKADRERIALRALNVYSPIARFLGLSGFVKDMENEAFKILFPGDYYRIRNFVEDARSEITQFLEDSTKFLSEILAENNINTKIDSRIKNIYSIYAKDLRYRQRGVETVKKFKHLYDLVAIRVIVDTVEQCYLVDDLIKKVWESVPRFYEDYIANPKLNGYQSIHSVFDVSPNFNAEIQIRTHQMHSASEYGIASHTFYKTGSKFRKKLEEDPEWLRRVNYWEKEYSFGTPNIDEQDKAKPFSDEIYVFTPKGDIIQLERGATVLDFAYAVHVELGHACIGAMVNNKIAKLSDLLEDGDTVEVRISKTKKSPSRDWLKFAASKKAQVAIRKKLRSV